MSGPVVVCVLGMHRSGTSLVTRLVNLLGVHLGPPEHMMEALPENPGGFWEHQQLTDVNIEILSRLGGDWHEPPIHAPGWELSPDLEDLRQRARAVIEQDFGAASVWGWKDPRMCLTLPFWQRLVPPMRFLMCVRNPIDVAHSLERRNGFPFEKGVDLWLTYVQSALAHTAGQRRCLVFYEDVMKNWRLELRRLAAFLDLPELSESAVVQAAVEEFVKVEWQHHRTSIVSAVDETRLTFPAKALYLVLRLYAKPRPGECRGWDDVDLKLDAALDRFGEYSAGARTERRDRAAEVAGLQAELGRESRDRAADVEALQRELGRERRDRAAEVEALQAELGRESRDRAAEAEALQRELSRERGARAAEVEALQTELSLLGQQLETLLHSRSWRLTAPLRRACSIFRSGNQGST